MQKNHLESTLSEKLKMRIVSHRNELFRILSNRYFEFLPLVINYEGIENLPINPILIEHYLRQGFGVAIGETKKGIMVLGSVLTQPSLSKFNDFYKPLITKDINFIISPEIRENFYKEITFRDGYESGNFIVLYNKPFNYTNDYEIIRHYVEEISEINVSRFSIYIQSKVNTILRGVTTDDEDITKIADDMYNGSPYIMTTQLFDPEENILKIGGLEIVSVLPELKREYQNKLAELNSMLGLNSLGVDKESGVSDTEANSNKSFKKANENIYLRARNQPLSILNKKYGYHIKAEYNDSMLTELSSLERYEMVKG